METDLAYFHRRAREEHTAAANADTPQAQLAHREMAGRYEDLALAIAAQAHDWGINLDGEAEFGTDQQQALRASMWL